jgi:hypothetical protein
MSRLPEVLHVIPRLSRGGAGRALLCLTETLSDFQHRVLSLEPGEAIDGLEPARRSELATADIVHVHFWNVPALHELLTGPLPPTRLLLAAEVGGDHPPQVLTRAMIEHADMIVAGAPRPDAARLRVIPAVGGWERIEGVEPVRHEGFNVGYVGTVGFAKMHPRYVAMSARIRVPGVRFVVCGGGAAFPTLARQAEALGALERFDLRGWSEDVAAVLSELDVFGYPLCEDNYALWELALQEAMYAGVPPVVLPHGGAARLVQHGLTGLVARDEDDYARAVEFLHEHPDERRRMGRAAREHAIAAWSPTVVARDWEAAYGELLAEPKRARSWRRDPELERAAVRAPGAARFVESLGEAAGPFRTSLLSDDPGRVLAAEHEIATSSPVLAGADSGGILHYRGHYRDDPYLRLWSGLVLEQQGRPALAAGEFAGALAAGLDRAEQPA